MSKIIELTDLVMKNIQIYQVEDGTLAMSLNYTLVNAGGERIGDHANIELTAGQKTAVKNFVKQFVIDIAEEENVTPPSWTGEV